MDPSRLQRCSQPLHGAYVPIGTATMGAVDRASDLLCGRIRRARHDSERLTNVTLFEAVSPTRTHVESYGVGYGTSPEYGELLEFFIAANRSFYLELKRQLE